MTIDTSYTACNISEDGSTRENCFSPKRLFKYVGFMLICLLTFGVYFCYDNPGALQDKFETDLKLPVSKFVILYAVYSWPNVILCFFGGFLVDSVFGVKWGTIIYLTLALCGQLLFALGTFVDIFWLMVLGRFLFGIGAESVNAAQNSYTFIWFRGKALNFLFGFQWSIAQIGSILNSLTIGNIYELVSETSNYSGHKCLGIVLFIAAITCFASIVCAFLLGYMHSSSEKVSKENDEKPPELVKLTDIKDFNVNFWLIVLITSAYCAGVYPFTALAKVYFMTKYKLEPDAANNAISMTYTICAITSPLFGILFDKVGRNIIWIIVSIVGSLLAHGLLAFTYVSPYTCMVVLGLSSSVFVTSAWPMVAQVMPEHQLGTAYGIHQAVLNLSMAVTPIINGIIVENYGYFILELFFMAWLFASLIPAVMFWMSDRDSREKTYVVVEKPDENKDLFLDDLIEPSVKCVNEKLLHS